MYGIIRIDLYWDKDGKSKLDTLASTIEHLLPGVVTKVGQTGEYMCVYLKDSATELPITDEYRILRIQDIVHTYAYITRSAHIEMYNIGWQRFSL